MISNIVTDDSVRRTFDASAKTLKRACQPSLDGGASSSSVVQVLQADWWFLKEQLHELDAAFESDSYAKLPQAKVSAGGQTEPRVYQAISETLNCLIASPMGIQALGKLLTTSALAELLSPGHVGGTLTTGELWAVPVIVKLLLIVKVASCVSNDLAQRDLTQDDACTNEVRSALACLHALAGLKWRVVAESISAVHQILAQDPCGTYLKMEPESRQMYQNAVAEIAAESQASEVDVARCALTLAWEAAQNHEIPARCDTGYYLFGAGKERLRRRGGFRPSVVARFQEWTVHAPNVVYLGGIAFFTALFTAAFARIAGPLSARWIAALLLPASVPAVALVNMLVTLTVPRRLMPRLDFSIGIPEEHRTCVAIPTLLFSRANVERLLERLEIHYLANRCGPNLVFALLTDFPDRSDLASVDSALLEFCKRGIRRLNERYATKTYAPFYLFHRDLSWNPSQQRWMGRERKRGKLEDFNQYLLGLNDAFSVKAGELDLLGEIKHVITLDSDTQLPRDGAWRLIGTQAHPLQRPLVDPIENKLVSGYPILQPAIRTNMESAGRSWFARIFAGQTGVDPYTGASADVYHDLYGRASFVGKGIYEVFAMHTLLDRRFPDNTLLSHDLIEGEYTRTGLVTDVDFVEDHPLTHEVWTKRQHRWIRGDWQILDWLFRRVPAAGGGKVANPLSLVSRWKIADNLRRSLVEINLLLVLVAAWWFVPASAVRMSIGILLIIAWPACLDLAALFLNPPPALGWRGHMRERVAGIWRALREAFFNLIFLPNQAMVAADGILRTLYRHFVTHRNLLEWETMAQVEAAGDGGVSWATVLYLGVVTLAIAWGGYLQGSMSHLSAVLAILWATSPLTARFLRLSPRHPEREHPRDVEFLRDISLRTWRYFADFSRPQSHWLVPDNMQENPETLAHRASPTNIGLQLASYVAACDFGYLTRQELVSHLDNILLTLDRLDRYKGHFFNWYETETLAPLPPRYVSTVDSGNLAATLIAVKQACDEIRKQPLIAFNILDGMRDHCVRLRRHLPTPLKRSPIVRTLHALMRLTEARPANLFQWNDVLTQIAVHVDEMNQISEGMKVGLSISGPSNQTEEFDYWRRALTKRARAAQAGTRHLAPWLAETYECLFKDRGLDPAFEDLLALLARNPALDQMSATFDAIDVAISGILTQEPTEGIHGGAWRGDEDSASAQLEQLRREIRTARLSVKLLLDGLTRNETVAGQFAQAMDFSFLFDADREQLRIGYNTQADHLDDSYYDLLASEARTAVFLAVAKGDVPRRTWFQLGRKLGSLQGHQTLVSWSGTMFEYLMPTIFMKTFAPSLLGKSLHGVVRAQQAYGREQKVPWGISESSCSTRDGDSNYDYRAFGIPGVAMSADGPNKLVVAPYASMLALMVDRRQASENLRRMASRGWTGRYGFFEAVDFQSPRARGLKQGTVVRSFMAHHQGMGFLALCNVLLGNPMQARFHADPMVAATELLLQERVPTVFGDTPSTSDGG